MIKFLSESQIKTKKLLFRDSNKNAILEFIPDQHLFDKVQVLRQAANKNSSVYAFVGAYNISSSQKLEQSQITELLNKLSDFSSENCKKELISHIEADGLPNIPGIKRNIKNVCVIDTLNIGALKSVLIKFPVIATLKIYSNFSKSVNGFIRLPENSDRYIGSHEMVITGYNDKTEMFTVLNSCGEDWGINGYGQLPYEYIIKFAINLCYFEIT
jgi:hypothetical protein